MPRLARFGGRDGRPMAVNTSGAAVLSRSIPLSYLNNFISLILDPFILIRIRFRE